MPTVHKTDKQAQKNRQTKTKKQTTETKNWQTKQKNGQTETKKQTNRELEKSRLTRKGKKSPLKLKDINKKLECFCTNLLSFWRFPSFATFWSKSHNVKLYSFIRKDDMQDKILVQTFLIELELEMQSVSDGQTELKLN